jgi:uncharacterized protein involved in response to NO
LHNSPVILSYAFRPFFLLSAAAAIAVVTIWTLALRGVAVLPPGLDTMQWHGHEMLIGFAMATIAGFVLTAVSTWTGRDPVRGRVLLLLAACWLLGRIAMALAGQLPVAAVLVADMLFPLGLCVLAGREVIVPRNRRNYPIVAILVFLATLNLAYHLGVAGLLPRADRVALSLFIHTILLLITIVGGRILPNFTANWLRAQQIQDLPVNNPLADRLTIGITLLLGISISLFPAGPAGGWLALGAALLHGWRLSRWRGLATLREPLLFMLHVAYLWLPLGYAALGLAVLGGIGSTGGASHILSIGGIGGMILAMITRVPLGHTGRRLQASRMTVIAYASLIAAVLLRAFSLPGSVRYLDMLTMAALAWCLAFGIFVLAYWPVLTKPRVERPG